MKLLIPLLFFCSFYQAVYASPSQDFLTRFQSARILFPSDNSDYAAVNPGRYPPWMFNIFQKLFLWKPVGQKSEYAEGCRPEDIGMDIMNNPDSREQAHIIEIFKTRCHDSFQNGSTLSLVNGLKIMSMELDIHHHALMHRVVFHLAGGVRLKGILALKGDLRKRPFVVVRLGIYSNVEEFLPERFLLTQFFEQGLANVLVLENMTSPDFIANNQHFSVGGFQEGLQNMQVARILRDPGEPLSRMVSSLHFVGVSLGGHGVLFASLLNELNKKKDRILVQSFTGICPVVDLKKSMQLLQRDWWRVPATDYWSSLRLQGLQTKIPVLSDYNWLDVFKFKAIFLPRTLDAVAENFTKYPPALGHLNLPQPLEQTTDFWKANDFWPYYRDINSEVLVVATKNDDLVNPQANFFWLQQHAPQMRSRIGTVLFEEGYHCTLPVAYDWPTISSIFNARVMSFDSSTKIRSRELRMDVTEHVPPDQLSQFKKTHFATEWSSDTHEVLVKFRGSGKSEFQVKIPVDELDFKFRDPLQSPEKLSVERWLNQNLQFALRLENDRVMAFISYPQVL